MRACNDNEVCDLVYDERWDTIVQGNDSQLEFGRKLLRRLPGCFLPAERRSVENIMWFLVFEINHDLKVIENRRKQIKLVV